MKIKYDNSNYYTITRRKFTKNRDILFVDGTSLWQKIKGYLYIIFKLNK